MNSQFQSSETINKARIQKVAVDVGQNSIKVAKALGDITAYNQRSIIVISLKSELQHKYKEM